MVLAEVAVERLETIAQLRAALEAARAENRRLRMICDSDEFDVFDRLHKHDQAKLARARAEIERLKDADDEARQHRERISKLETMLAQARVMATNYKADAELQSERVTEQRTDLLPQIASLQTDLAQAQARIAELEEQAAEYKASVVGQLRGLVESHMDMARGQWQCVPVVDAARKATDWRLDKSIEHLEALGAAARMAGVLEGDRALIDRYLGFCLRQLKNLRGSIAALDAGQGHLGPPIRKPNSA
jgi:multidrug resistance efflux pump